ncbi:hypothetical protein NUW54_g3759 [Trametes sanguinea]|uniref:Uncharacterized protein n=1 Tax=Trametes sanguinea TaxID=158606 RepID=A0ACC1Q2M6_9APHY|nr:hypothetical protein NUW54_g3759 [Trametes sanguinea]
MSNKSLASSTISDATLDAFMQGLDLAVIRDLAIAARRVCPGALEPPGELSCHVVTPAKSGSYNVEKQYSDSKGEIAYLMADIADVSPRDINSLREQINMTSANILTRMLA